MAERFADPAVHKSLAVARAWIGHDDALLRDLEGSVLTTAKDHHPTTRYWLRTVPGIGERLRLVLRYDIHAIHRVPRLQDFVSSCRLVQCAKASAENRDGTGGSKIGQADLTGACSEAAVLCLRDTP